MPTFAYIARDPAGERVVGQLDCPNQQAALAELQTKGLAPVRLNAVATRVRRRRAISTRRLASAYGQLADLLRAGVPLLRALRLLGGSRADPRLAAVMTAVADAIADGDRLADAMAQHPDVFPPVQVAMVRAGERGAFLDQVLERLAVFIAHQAEMRSKVIGNLIYPVILLVAGVSIVVAAMIFFVPRFKGFIDKGMELPLPTRLLLGTSDLLVNHWLLVLVALGFLAGGMVWLWRHPPVRRQLAVWQLRIPLVGTLVRSLCAARFSRVLGTMLGNGIPMLQAMRIARDAAGHALLEDAVDEATDAMRAGESLAGPLGSSGFLDAGVIEMIAVGESANNLPAVLVAVADTLEKRIDQMLALVIRLMEPLLLLILAGVVVFIFIALIVPMMQLSSSL
ncbi:MAG: type II secretion system F family protein [Phycisphaerales bacterium]|nr:type II secretion system F family protein [Phycisphaerales bacterium]